MLQELARETGAQAWSIASMLFFLLAFAIVAVLVWRAEPATVDACARLPLEDGDGTSGPGNDHPSTAAPADRFDTV